MLETYFLGWVSETENLSAERAMGRQKHSSDDLGHIVPDVLTQSGTFIMQKWTLGQT